KAGTSSSAGSAAAASAQEAEQPEEKDDREGNPDEPEKAALEHVRSSTSMPGNGGGREAVPSPAKFPPPTPPACAGEGGQVGQCYRPNCDSKQSETFRRNRVLLRPFPSARQ